MRSTATAATAANPKEWILVADDHHAFRDLVSFLVQMTTGLAVEAASNGRDALTKLERGVPPRMLVVDLEMPFVPGTELIRRARAQHLGVPIIAMSARDQRDEVLNLGGDDFLLKPFGLAELDEKLRYWLEPQQAA